MPTSNASPSAPETENSDSLNGFGGWLILLVGMLLFVYPLVTLIGIAVSASQIPWLSLFSSITEPATYLTAASMVVELALGAYAVYGGIKLLRIKAGAVRSVKTFLAGVFAYNLLMFVLTLIAEHRVSTAFDNAVTAEVRNIVFALFWYAYLELSKRVATTYAG